MVTKYLTFLTLAVVPTTSALATDLQDLHLPLIERTNAERDRIADVTTPTQDFTQGEPFETNQAGTATVRNTNNSNAFSSASDNISFERELDFKLGNGLFRKLWVSSPSSTLASDGLGPIYNARSCQRCHLKDGRGHPPESLGDSAVSLLVRTSIPDPNTAAHQIEGYLATLPEPTYGGQIQDFSIAGHPAEAKIAITYEEQIVEFPDGEQISLRKPNLALTNLGYGPLHPDAMLSARIAPQMIGLGLLDAIPVADILANVDENDANADGISGRANIVWSQEYDQPMLGRFGLKAGQPSVWEQSAGAFHGDIGISTTLHPTGYGDCTARQVACQNAPDGNTDIHDGAEISDEAMDLVSFYASNLGVPARRDVENADVLRGKQMFYQSGCTSCHTPKFVTHRLEDQPEQSFQLIWPYSDMLLHDMGEGLADNRPEARATGREWRTPPLWGIGLTHQVSGHTNFLHDGRARSLLEAVMWHGGEAETAKDAVASMSKSDRNALIKFLGSL